MTYWPGTNIPKSTGNAFDWRGKGSAIASTQQFKQSQLATKQMAGKGSEKSRQFTIYSKARAAK